jgi:carbonic anhydrase
VSFAQATAAAMLKQNSPEESVKEDVQLLRESAFFKDVQIMGFVQDTETGLLKEVTCGKSKSDEKIAAISQ